MENLPESKKGSKTISTSPREKFKNYTVFGARPSRRVRICFCPFIRTPRGLLWGQARWFAAARAPASARSNEQWITGTKTRHFLILKRKNLPGKPFVFQSRRPCTTATSTVVESTSAAALFDGHAACVECSPRARKYLFVLFSSSQPITHGVHIRFCGF